MIVKVQIIFIKTFEVNTRRKTKAGTSSDVLSHPHADHSSHARDVGSDNGTRDLQFATKSRF